MDLVGRQAATASMQRALADAVRGRGRLVLVTGEPGIGKTALARATADAAEAEGATVRWAAAWEGEAEQAFGIWLQLAVPGLGDALLSDPAADRSLAFERAGAALASAAASTPHVLVLDDLHWADGASLRLLAHLAGRLPAMPVLAVGTFRDREIDPAGPLAALGGSVDRIPLAGLAEPDVAALLADALGTPPPDTLAGEVAQRTGGNPFFVTQIGRLLAASPRSPSAGIPLPSGVRDVLSRQLARLPDPTHHALLVAAVLGQAFDAGALADVLGEPVDAVLDLLAPAESARIAGPDPAAPRVWTFVHALYQQSLLEGASAGERARLHRAVADVLERRPGVPAAELARHHLAAVRTPGDDRAARWSLAAGDEALARLAWEEAGDHFRRALAEADGLTTTGRHSLRAAALIGLGGALLRSGDHDEAGFAFAAAADAAEDAGDASLLARAALGFGAGLGGFEIPMFDRRQVDLLERALAGVPATDPARPLLLARLSVALSFLDTPGRRLALAEEAVEQARTSGDGRALVAGLAAHCDAIAGPSGVERRLADATEIVAIAAGLGDRRLELLGRRFRYVALLELGRFAQVEIECAAYARAAAELGDPLYEWYVPLWHGRRALAEGRFDDALALAGEAAAIGARAGSANAEVLAWVLRSGVAWEHLDPGGAELIADYAAANPDTIGPNGVFTAAGVWADLGDAARVEAELRAAPPFAELPVDAEWLPATASYLVCGALVALVDLPEAVAAALAHEELFVFEGIGAQLRGSLGRFCGPALAAVGRVDEAVEVARRAAERDAAAGAVVAAHARRDLARCLLAAGDADGARREGEAALRAYAALGLDRHVARWGEALGLDGGPSPAAAPPPVAGATGAATLVREGDTWAFAFGGRTVRVRHGKGIADLAVLLARPGTPVHVRELDPSAPPSTGVTGGPRLDAQAIDAYKARVRELEADIDEADGFGDAARAERLRAERDFIVDELAGALGLGGRARAQAGDPDERLRKAVSARVRDAIRRIEEHHERLGRHLRNSVKTGFWCSYEPEEPVIWRIQP